MLETSRKIKENLFHCGEIGNQNFRKKLTLQLSKDIPYRRIIKIQFGLLDMIFNVLDNSNGLRPAWIIDFLSPHELAEGPKHPPRGHALMKNGLRHGLHHTYKKIQLLELRHFENF